MPSTNVLRSPRLETVLDGRLDSVNYGQILSLATNQVAEAADLEFKGSLYARSDAGKAELAKDVAAIANSGGGVIFLGISDHDDRAATATGVALSGEAQRIYQIVASNVHPLPTFDVREVEDPQKSGHGFLMITVAPSLHSPHAVSYNDGYKFPRRNGPHTIFLSEAEIAAAYRNRFAGIQEHFEALERYERDLVDKLETSGQTFAVINLNPDLGGDFSIDSQVLQQFQVDVLQRHPRIFTKGSAWWRAGVRPGRLTADGGSTRPEFLACELHTTGAGAFAGVVQHRSPDADASHIPEDQVVDVIMSGLRFLARHARDRAGVGGNANIRATLWPVSADLPATLDHPGYLRGLNPYETISTAPVSTGVANIDDIADDGPALVRAAYGLASGLFQHFGCPEAKQLTVEGGVRTLAWAGRQLQQQVRQWAESCSVATVEGPG